VSEYDELRLPANAPSVSVLGNAQAQQLNRVQSDFADFFASMFGSGPARAVRRSKTTASAAKSRDVEIEMPVFLKRRLKAPPTGLNSCCTYRG